MLTKAFEYASYKVKEFYLNWRRDCAIRDDDRPYPMADIREGRIREGEYSIDEHRKTRERMGYGPRNV